MFVSLFTEESKEKLNHENDGGEESYQDTEEDEDEPTRGESRIFF